ncbi:hypothetical protein CDO52_00775 [Nocardiopsis gilva YIM 90087]|uniref:Terminase n=1 Tax=Nocardiopsis gilva YIM 90087 TaxID=1235441 RepID=A0A223SCT3_9ACTN|nr:hypothetical protein CDO52_00775 [Nocardiopsis gilva YIM 90087]
MLLGEQQPRIRVTPPALTSAGQEAVDLAASAGLILDPWQQLALETSLGERADGSWSAFECGLIVGRQNGKGSILEARELAGLFLFGEELIIHSAHEFKTSKEHFRRMERLIKANPDFLARVDRFHRSHGEEGVELKDGRRLVFATRTGGGGRGFSGDLIILDEAYNLTDDHMAALLPTLSARPNPQLWYTSSAPDKDLAPCEVLSRVRRRALSGDSSRLAFFEWSADVCDELCPVDCDQHDNPMAPETWARANPGFGIRISREFIESERAAMSPEAFARERLSVGNYVVEGNAWLVISEEAWTDVRDEDSTPAVDEPLAFGIDVTPDQSYACIAVAGLRGDGLVHVEIAGTESELDHRSGTGWVVPRVKELVDRWRPCAVVLDAGGPGGTLMTKFEKAGIELTNPSTREYAQACGDLKNSVEPKRGNSSTLRHRGQVPLDTAVAGAAKRDLADLWAWNRRGAAVDISPLVAATLAVWGHGKKAHIGPETATPWVAFR